MISRTLFAMSKSRRLKKVSIPSSTYKSGVIYTQNVRMNGLRKNDVVLLKNGKVQHLKLFKNMLNISIGEVVDGGFSIKFRAVPGCSNAGSIETNFEIEVIPVL